MDNLYTEIQQIFMKATRYPAEILTPEADLEEDLGIDSVKMGEIFALLRERYSLPEKLDIPPEELRTIGKITDALHTFISVSSKVNTLNEKAEHKTILEMPEIASGPPVAISGSGSNDMKHPVKRYSIQELQDIIIATIADFTHYPKEILALTANLEDEIGIDFAKLSKIIESLHDQFGVSKTKMVDIHRIHTVNDVVSAITDSLYGGQLANTDVLNRSQISQRKSVPGLSSGDVFLSSDNRQKPFAGKVALVTGSGHGLGKVIACRLAELGAYVIINSFHSRNCGDETVAEINAQGGQALHLWGSVSNPVHLNKIFDEIESRFGVLDFFISNASNGILAYLKDVTVDHWEKAFRTNVIGFHQGAIRAAALMKNRGCGRIVALSSQGANRYVEYFGCMGTVKAAVESLTRTLAVELAPYHIRVNAIAPSAIYGDLLSLYPDKERLVPIWESKSLENRLCKPEEAAEAVVFLLSERSSFITGSTMVIDGGLSLRGT